MTQARTLTGAVVLWVFAIGALGASSALATNGLTAVECVESPGGNTGTFETSHCETPAAGKKYETKVFPLNEAIEGESEAVGGITLHGTLFGLNVTITCTSAHTTGKAVNVTPSGSGAEM